MRKPAKAATPKPPKPRKPRKLTGTKASTPKSSGY
jgi:hypothetical protein